MTDTTFRADARPCHCDRGPACTATGLCATCAITAAFDNGDPAEAAAIAADEGVSVERLMEIFREVERAREKHDASAELVRRFRALEASNDVAHADGEALCMDCGEASTAILCGSCSENVDREQRDAAVGR